MIRHCIQSSSRPGHHHNSAWIPSQCGANRIIIRGCWKPSSVFRAPLGLLLPRLSCEVKRVWK